MAENKDLELEDVKVGNGSVISGENERTETGEEAETKIDESAAVKAEPGEKKGKKEEDKEKDKGFMVHVEEDDDPRCCRSLKTKAYRNVFGTGVSFMMSLSAVVSLFSLQSSLNDTAGLGLANLSIFMGFFFISGIFASSIIRILGTKYTLVFSYTLLGVYTVANFYPQWYTLVPAAVFGGMGFGPVFAAGNVHVTTVAIRYAHPLGEKTEHLVSLFTGIQAMFFKVSYIPGSLATAAILFSERLSNGSEIIMSPLGDVCDNDEASKLNPTYVYILISVDVVFDIIAIIVCLLLLDNLQEGGFKKGSRGKVWKQFIKKPIVATFKMFKSWKMYMIIPMMVLDGYLASFALGTYYRAYVSECIGVHWVGFVVCTFGICSGLSAVIGGRLVKCIPQFSIVYTVSATLFGLMFFLIFWETRPSYVVAFVVIAVWGICEGIWHSVPPSLVGVLFHRKQEPAFSVSRMGLATGMLLGFSTAIFLTVPQLLWVAFCFLVVSLVAYSFLVFKTETRHQLIPCCPRREDEPEEEEENYEQELEEEGVVEVGLTENVF